MCNLCDHIPDLSIDRVAEAMLRAFESVYDNGASHIEDSSIAAQEIEALREEFASRTWLLKGEEVLGHSAETRFSWGCVRVDWSEQAGVFDKVVLFSDGLDADFLDAIPYALCGCPREKEAICKTLDPLVVFSASSTEEEKTQCIRDIANLVCEERL